MQESIDTGKGLVFSKISVGKGRTFRPMYIQVQTETPVKRPTVAPIDSTKGAKIPRAKIAKVAPPTIPLSDKAASRIPPRLSA